MNRSGWKSVGLIAAIAVIGGVALLLLSPLLLLVPRSLFGSDWQTLSNIGQSYTGVAALFSAAALIGVAYSIRLQTKQNAMIQGQAVREMQVSLQRFAMENPSYLSIFHSTASSSSNDRIAKRFYLNQWMRYLQYGNAIGEITDASLRRILENDLFPVASNRIWWSTAKDVYEADYQHSRTNFLQIANESCDAAERAAT
ncbi:MAG: hypothetical protein EKK42_13875 [Pseudonocardiaceae bacterium]|nr:MAG: hypothetical protein EKK42_13875 [Pseudonocardiaceae bacterium]